MSKVKLKYWWELNTVSNKLFIVIKFNQNLIFSGIAFSSPEVPPTIEQIDHSFGATHPGG